MNPELLLEELLLGTIASCSTGFLPQSLYAMKSVAKLVTAGEDPRYSDKYSLTSPADCNDMQNSIRVMSSEPFMRLRQAEHHSLISALISLPPKLLLSALGFIAGCAGACLGATEGGRFRGMLGPVIGGLSVGAAGAGAERCGAEGLGACRPVLFDALDAHDMGCFFAPYDAPAPEALTALPTLHLIATSSSCMMARRLDPDEDTVEAESEYGGGAALADDPPPPDAQLNVGVGLGAAS